MFIFLGFQMPAWFDLFSLDPTGQEDDRGIEKSKQIITNLIEQEINNGIDPSRIVLGGFSQGTIKTRGPGVFNYTGLKRYESIDYSKKSLFFLRHFFVKIGV